MINTMAVPLNGAGEPNSVKTRKEILAEQKYELKALKKSHSKGGSKRKDY